MLKDAQAEGFEGKGGQRGIERSNEILVKPLCLFHLETDSFDGFKLFVWQVDDEPDT